MLKYAKIEDENTKICSVGIGTDIEFYKSIGMTEIDVEQAYDGQWYVLGYIPLKPIKILEEEYLREVDRWLDEFVQIRRYDNIKSCCSYITSTDEQFQKEGVYATKLRDVTYRACYDILDAVKSGEREIPSLDELYAELPISSASWDNI